MVRHILDVKGIDMGNGIIRYKAEVDVDGRELARFYLAKKDMEQMMKESIDESRVTDPIKDSLEEQDPVKDSGLKFFVFKLCLRTKGDRSRETNWSMTVSLL